MELIRDENRKRKRTKNTAPEQYELYLQFLEGDYYFRSDTINPSLEDKYIENKWKEMTEKLNSLGQGPTLTVQEWTKRFTDWKNSTRAKYRKIQECRLKTGGGPETKLDLTPYEERVLSCWGEVAVTGSNLVKETGGLCLQNNNLECDVLNEKSAEPFTIIAVIAEDPEDSDAEIIQDISKKTVSKSRNQIFTPHKNKKHFIQRSTPRVRQSRYETTAQLLMDSCNSSTNVQQKIIENKYNLEKERLRFEIEKFKFLNPDFQFDLKL